MMSKLLLPMMFNFHVVMMYKHEDAFHVCQNSINAYSIK